MIVSESFDDVDDVDFHDWLLADGALRETAECALVRAIVYDLGFAYEGGDPQRPSCEAGTALRGLLRAFFTYRGSLMWRMNSGMGDVIFLPLYELLTKRGVEVNFFHRVEKLRAANGVIEEIEIDVQADVPSDTPPEAYVTVTPPAAGRRSSPGRRIRTRSSEAPATRPRPTSPGTSVGTPPGSTPSPAPRGRRRVRPGRLRAADQLRAQCCARPGLALAAVEAGGGPSQDRPHPGDAALAQEAGLQARRVDDGIVVSGYVEPFDTWADMCSFPHRRGERLRHRGLLLQRAGRRAAAAWRRRSAVARPPKGAGARPGTAVPPKDMAALWPGRSTRPPASLTGTCWWRRQR